MAVNFNQRGGALRASTASFDDNFGRSVSLSDNGLVLVVGEPYQDDVAAGGIANSGAVYTYDLVSGAWVQRGAALNASNFSQNILFGSAVAISANGLVLAVSAVGQGSNAGYVYIYDLVSGAWVQRGSAFSRGSNPDPPYQFGNALSLSNNGAILVVGDVWHTDPALSATYIVGAVYIYDWNGSAWVQRGSKIVPSSITADTAYAYGVSISKNGLVLAVSRINGGGSVYIYDWNGSAWVLRGTPLVCPLASQLNYGLMVGLSATGEWLLTGSLTPATPTSTMYLLRWNGSAWITEAQQNINAYSVSDFSGCISADALVVMLGLPFEAFGTIYGAGYAATFDVVPPPQGEIECPTRLTVIIPPNLIEAPTSLLVVAVANSVECATRLDVNALGSIECATALAVIAPGHIPQWSARCIIDGVDVSSKMTGVASVTAEEGGARIAAVSLLPAAGVIAPLDYVGKSITLDYVMVIAGTDVPRRLFTGRIDTPNYDLNTSILELECVDDLQNRVAALPRSTIDGLIGGRYTEAVQGKILDTWEYAQARLSTVAGSLDAGANGGMRYTPWEIAATWATYGEADLIYQQAALVYPQRSTLINAVTITFDYRYPRLRSRYASTGWSGTHIDMAPCGWQYPTQQDILGAAGGSGWTVTLGVFYPAPASVPHSSGGFIYPPAGSIDMAILYMAQRHSQTVTESYAVTVSAPESVALNGEMPHALSAALESSFDGKAWESALDVAPLMPTGGEMDYSPDATRANSDYAIQTLLDRARVKILGSHRNARVSNATLCNPDLDLDKRVTISGGGMSAAGKVARINHILDLAAGTAITEFSIAISGVGGAGIITPDTLAPPAPPAPAVEVGNWSSGVASMFVNVFGVTTYTESLMGLLLNPPESISVKNVPGIGNKSYPNPFYVAGSYPVQGFRIKMPGVDDADRNPIIKPVAQSYQMIVPADPLTFTVL